MAPPVQLNAVGTKKTLIPFGPPLSAAGQNGLGSVTDTDGGAAQFCRQKFP